jgi:hypothetical protein
MYHHIEFSVTAESLAGHVSDSWKYAVEAKVFSPGLVASGSIAVDEHRLPPGTTLFLHDRTRKIVLPVRPGEAPAEVVLSVDADGVTWREDDDNPGSISIPIRCPEPGEPPYTIETDIPLAIGDAPGFTGGDARLTVRARLVASAAPARATSRINARYIATLYYHARLARLTMSGHRRAPGEWVVDVSRR